MQLLEGHGAVEGIESGVAGDAGPRAVGVGTGHPKIPDSSAHKMTLKMLGKISGEYSGRGKPMK
jgi:hypothetical protein